MADHSCTTCGKAWAVRPLAEECEASHLDPDHCCWCNLERGGSCSDHIRIERLCRGHEIAMPRSR